MERLLSAFRDKFVGNYGSSAYFKAIFGVKIQRRFRKRKDVSPTGNGNYRQSERRITNIYLI